VPKIITIEEEVEYIQENIIEDCYTEEIAECDINHYRQYGQILPTRYTSEVQVSHVDCPVYHDNIIESIFEDVHDNIIEDIIEEVHEYEVCYEVEKPVYHDNIIVNEVRCEQPYTTYHEYERVVEKPVYRENIITREIPCEHIVTQEVHVDCPHYVDRPFEVVYEQHQDVWCDKIVEIENVIEKPCYRDNVIRKPIYRDHIVEKAVEHIVHHHYDVEKIIDIPVEYVTTEVIENRYDVVKEKPVHSVKHVEVEYTVDCPVYIDNIIEQDVHYEVEQRVNVEHLVECPVYKDNIIEKEVICEQICHEYYDVPIDHERIVEVEVEKLIYTEVIVERPIHVEYYIEEEVIYENLIERPVERETIHDNEHDHDLKHRYEHCEKDYKHLEHKHHELKEKLKHTEHKYHKLGSNKDWYKEIQHLRRKITDLEIQISSSKKTHTKGSTREKITTVNYIEDPEAQALRSRINELRSKNKAWNDKISFHNQRMSVGSRNYTSHHETEHGSSVRRIRKSEKNTAHVDIKHSDVHRGQVTHGHHNNHVEIRNSNSHHGHHGNNIHREVLSNDHHGKSHTSTAHTSEVHTSNVHQTSVHKTSDHHVSNVHQNSGHHVSNAHQNSGHHVSNAHQIRNH